MEIGIHMSNVRKSFDKVFALLFLSLDYSEIID